MDVVGGVSGIYKSQPEFVNYNNILKIGDDIGSMEWNN